MLPDGWCAVVDMSGQPCYAHPATKRFFFDCMDVYKQPPTIPTSATTARISPDAICSAKAAYTNPRCLDGTASGYSNYNALELSSDEEDDNISEPCKVVARVIDQNNRTEDDESKVLFEQLDKENNGDAPVEKQAAQCGQPWDIDGESLTLADND